MPNFNGFSPKQLVALWKAHRNAGVALKRAAEALQVFKAEGGRPFRGLLSSWFGDDSTETVNHLESVVENMVHQYDGDNWVGVYTATLPMNAYAVAEAFHRKGTSHAELLSQVKSLIDEKVATGQRLVIQFSQRFFELDAVGTQPGMESQMQTFLHEFSHVAAGTKDYHWEKSGDKFCYGVEGCDVAKKRGASKARNNAENISFFLSEFWYTK
ncbi:MAG TPA: hypothetical protein VMX16_17890 [Terriglobia bacterium]|nr:hypothetical protein [Terriglobia bacterium]